MTVKKKGNGTLIAIGGNEDRSNKLEVLRRVVEEARGSGWFMGLAIRVFSCHLNVVAVKYYTYHKGVVNEK